MLRVHSKLRQLSLRTARQLIAFSPRDLVHALDALSIMGELPSCAHPHISRRLRELAPRLELSSAAQVFLICARCHFQDAALFDAVAAAMTTACGGGKLSLLSTGTMINVVKAFGSLGYVHRPLLEALASELLESRSKDLSREMEGKLRRCVAHLQSATVHAGDRVERDAPATPQESSAPAVSHGNISRPLQQSVLARALEELRQGNVPLAGRLITEAVATAGKQGSLLRPSIPSFKSGELIDMLLLIEEKALMQSRSFRLLVGLCASQRDLIVPQLSFNNVTALLQLLQKFRLSLMDAPAAEKEQVVSICQSLFNHVIANMHVSWSQLNSSTAKQLLQAATDPSLQLGPSVVVALIDQVLGWVSTSGTTADISAAACVLGEASSLLTLVPSASIVDAWRGFLRANLTKLVRGSITQQKVERDSSATLLLLASLAIFGAADRESIAATGVALQAGQPKPDDRESIPLDVIIRGLEKMTLTFRTTDQTVLVSLPHQRSAFQHVVASVARLLHDNVATADVPLLARGIAALAQADEGAEARRVFNASRKRFDGYVSSCMCGETLVGLLGALLSGRQAFTPALADRVAWRLVGELWHDLSLSVRCAAAAALAAVGLLDATMIVQLRNDISAWAELSSAEMPLKLPDFVQVISAAVSLGLRDEETVSALQRISDISFSSFRPNLEQMLSFSTES